MCAILGNAQHIVSYLNDKYNNKNGTIDLIRDEFDLNFYYIYNIIFLFCNC